MNKINKFLSSLLIFLLVTYITAYSQSHSPHIKKMSKESDLIFTGKVLDQKSKWNDNKTMIYTDVTIEVEEYVKGRSSNRVIIRHPGGEVDDIGELYSHMPKFDLGEEVLLFAVKDKKDGKLRVCDGENGKVQIILDKVSGKKMTALNKKVSDLKKEIRMNSVK